MKRFISIFSILVFGLLYLWHDTADAARFGRGRSFGSKPSYQRKAAPSESGSAFQTTPGRTAQPTSPLNTQPSRTSGWKGMLGGLLAGGLIGALLFGGGFGGVGLLDLLLVGGGLFLLFRFLRARQMAAETPYGGSGAGSFEQGSAGPYPSGQREQESFDSSGLRSVSDDQPHLPPGFDEQDFIKGANAVYVRLQSAWDKRDLEDIRQFTSPEVFAEIKQQAEEDPTPSKTELLLITPKIASIREEDDQVIVSVLFDVMLREKQEEMPQQIRELWHFSQAKDKPQSFWRLEGIQQME